MADWQDKLNAYKTDKSAAQTEITRSKGVYESEKAAGAGEERLKEINTWGDQVRSAAGISNDDQTYGNADGVNYSTLGSMNNTNIMHTMADPATANPNPQGGPAVAPSVQTMANPAMANQTPANAQTMSAPQQAAASGVTNTMGSPSTTYQNGQTKDLTALYDEIGASKPNQQWTLKDLQDKMSASAVDGKKVDLSGLATSLGKKPGDTFTTDELKSAISAASKAGSPVAVQASKYQDPAQFQALINQMNQVLAPLTKAQQGAAQTSYGQQSSALADKWAANGLLASGGAMAQQQQGANALASQMSAIEAQQQANAVPLAQNFANLSLAEDQQKFAQNANNRDFTASQAQNNVGNLYNALGQQQNQQNQWTQNATNLAQMDVAQNQWAQQFGAQNKQNDINNQTTALGMQQNFLQDFLKNKIGVTGMDINQNQWSQEFGLQKNQQEFAQQLQTSQQNSQNQQFNANLGQQQNNQAQQNNQFNSNLGQQQNQFNSKLGLDQQQANGDMALKLSQMFGKAVDPKSDWGNMFSQVAGQNTSQSQSNVMDMLSKIMQNSPYMPQGMGNVAGQNSNYGSLQDILNGMGGQASQKTWDQNQQLGFETSKLAQDMNYKWANYAVDKDYKNHLMDLGISERDGKDNTNGMIADLMSFQNEAAAQNWLSDPKTIERAQAGGINMKAVQDVMSEKFKKPTGAAASGDNTKLLNDAYDYASKVVGQDFTSGDTPEQKQARLDKLANDYMSKHKSNYSGANSGNLAAP